MKNNFNFKESNLSIKSNIKKFIDLTLKDYNENMIYNEESLDIIKKYIDYPNIINKESSLILFINVLINQLTLGNNILIPFLDLCPILIKAYINSKLDEEKDLKNIEIFKLLKINSFISRENFYQNMNIFLIYFILQIKSKKMKIS